jgi:hypothetical protein
MLALVSQLAAVESPVKIARLGLMVVAPGTQENPAQQGCQGNPCPTAYGRPEVGWGLAMMARAMALLGETVCGGGHRPDLRVQTEVGHGPVLPPPPY